MWGDGLRKWRSALGVEVLGLGVVADDCAGRLLGVDLPVLSQLAPDALGLEEAEQLGLVRHLRARRVAKAEPPAAELLLKQLADRRRIVQVYPQLLAHALVPELGQ